MKTVAIVQSNYIPWKGYFDLIARVDEFILFDDMQFTRRDWRNRNKVKVSNGVTWLTVPVKSKGNYHQPIKDVELDGTTWSRKHWMTFKQAYSKSSHFDEIEHWLAPIYLERDFKFLTELNRSLIEAICGYLGIKTEITFSWDYDLIEGKTERLASLCSQAGGDVYVSGPAARGYLDERIFEEAQLTLEWFDYSGYVEYPQLWGEFVHEVSILDLLFNCGHLSKTYMRYVE